MPEIAAGLEAGYISSTVPSCDDDMSPGSPIDPKALDLLHSLESDRPGIMSELVRLFVADAPKQMQGIEDGYQSRDEQRVRQAAHFLRSGALALGVAQLAEASHAVERLDVARFGQPDADERLTHLRVALRDALLALLSQVKEI